MPPVRASISDDGSGTTFDGGGLLPATTSWVEPRPDEVHGPRMPAWNVPFASPGNMTLSIWTIDPVGPSRVKSRTCEFPGNRLPSTWMVCVEKLPVRVAGAISVASRTESRKTSSWPGGGQELKVEREVEQIERSTVRVERRVERLRQCLRRPSGQLGGEILSGKGQQPEFDDPRSGADKRCRRTGIQGQVGGLRSVRVEDEDATAAAGARATVRSAATGKDVTGPGDRLGVDADATTGATAGQSGPASARVSAVDVDLTIDSECADGTEFDGTACATSAGSLRRKQVRAGSTTATPCLQNLFEVTVAAVDDGSAKATAAEATEAGTVAASSQAAEAAKPAPGAFSIEPFGRRWGSPFAAVTPFPAAGTAWSTKPRRTGRAEGADGVASDLTTAVNLRGICGGRVDHKVALRQQCQGAVTRGGDRHAGCDVDRVEREYGDFRIESEERRPDGNALVECHAGGNDVAQAVHQHRDAAGVDRVSTGSQVQRSE